VTTATATATTVRPGDRGRGGESDRADDWKQDAMHV
jgi:hypothetical protein